jgi:hypothetical protein
VLNPRRVATTLVKLSNFKEDISDNDDKYKLPSMKKRSSQDFSYERYVKRFRNRLRYVTLFGKKHDPLIIVECLSIVTRFAIRFGTWYGFGYAVRNSQRIRYAGGIQSRYAIWVRGTLKFNNWYIDHISTSIY